MPTAPPPPDAGERLGEDERVQLAAVLSRRRPFELLRRDQLDWLVKRLRIRSHAAGIVIVPSGAPADRLHVIVDGSVWVGEGADSGTPSLQQGDCFPLEELHTRRPVLSTYRAVAATRCGELSEEHYRAALAANPDFRASCERRALRLAEKLRRLQEIQLAQMDSVMSQMSVQASGAEAIGARIRLARDTSAVARAAQGIPGLARLMMVRGVEASQVSKLVSSMNDRVCERVIQLETERAALSDVDFCWLALGSEGRMEQTLCTDQDNGIVFAASADAADRVRERLLPIARRINAALAECGFPLCQGEIMAGNPAWCLTVDEWRDRFTRWIDTPDPEALLHASIFFDLRPVHGHRELGQSLQRFLVERAPGERRFLALLAQNAMQAEPPLGLLRRFSVEKGGENAGTIDLKRDASRIFVDAARVLALATGVTGPGTEQRLREAGARSGMAESDVAACIEAFHYVQVIRFRLHHDLAQAQKPLHNHVDPYALNALEQRFLVEALRQAKTLQERLGRTQLGGVPT